MKIPDSYESATLLPMQYLGKRTSDYGASHSQDHTCTMLVHALSPLLAKHPMATFGVTDAFHSYFTPQYNFRSVEIIAARSTADGLSLSGNSAQLGSQLGQTPPRTFGYGSCAEYFARTPYDVNSCLGHAALHDVGALPLGVVRERLAISKCKGRPLTAASSASLTSLTEPTSFIILAYIIMKVFAVGSSRNIGYYTATGLLKQGHTVIFLVRNPTVFDDDEEVKSYIYSGKAMVVKGDALVPEQVQSAWQEANSEGAVDLVVFSVGKYQDK